jgi:2-C-methyl-D-erythritol 4-phosphate cytidylyltransferase
MNCAKSDIILVHDAVRPFITRKKIIEIMNEMQYHTAVIPGLKINDTLKKVSKNDYVVETMSRDNIWRIQTPQAFKYSLLMEAYDIAIKDKFIGTDEASLIEHANYRIRIIEGERTNIKITTKADLMIIDYNKLLK